MSDLFGNADPEIILNSSNAARIPGLNLYSDLISPAEEQELIASINAQPWLGDLSRKVQHYGYKYDYRARAIDASLRIGAIPDWMNFVIRRMRDQGIIDFDPDQAIVNHYTPGQGIAPHVDCEPCFTDTILSLSLGSDAVMEFRPLSDRKEKIPVLLWRRSLVRMTGEARYQFQHGIAGRKSDDFAGTKRPRGERISITFRKVILSD